MLYQGSDRKNINTYDTVMLISYQLLLVYYRTVHSHSNIILAANVTYNEEDKKYNSQ